MDMITNQSSPTVCGKKDYLEFIPIGIKKHVVIESDIVNLVNSDKNTCVSLTRENCKKILELKDAIDTILETSSEMEVKKKINCEIQQNCGIYINLRRWKNQWLVDIFTRAGGVYTGVSFVKEHWKQLAIVLSNKVYGKETPGNKYPMSPVVYLAYSCYSKVLDEAVKELIRNTCAGCKNGTGLHMCMSMPMEECMENFGASTYGKDYITNKSAQVFKLACQNLAKIWFPSFVAENVLSNAAIRIAECNFATVSEFMHNSAVYTTVGDYIVQHHVILAYKALTYK